MGQDVTHTSGSPASEGFSVDSVVENQRDPALGPDGVAHGRGFARTGPGVVPTSKMQEATAAMPGTGRLCDHVDP